MPEEQDQKVQDGLATINGASTEEEALAVEASLIEQTDNGLKPGDPDDQPEQPEAGVQKEGEPS